MRPARELFTGWSRTAPTAATAISVSTVEEVEKAVADAPPDGVVARGLGRSYGDPAQNGGGVVLQCTPMSGLRHLDLERGVVTAYSGTSIHQLMQWLVPLGWFVPVTPGTRFVTVGGAIASDIHGKNHHVDGSFCNAVESMTLLLASGERRTLTPDGTPDAFWATAGGMGLTGVVLDATFRLRRITTSRMVVDTERAKDLDDCMARMDRGDEHRYGVAWIDTLARGGSLGRGVITSGDHATPDQLTDRQGRDPLRFAAGTKLVAPPWVPSGLVNRWTGAAFIEFWFRKAPVERRGQVQSIASFFHPLDMISGWNSLYGHRGFVQHQCVLPTGAEDTLRTILERTSAARAPSFVTVLKRFGPGNSGHLSFPMPGWTLTLDVPLIKGLGPLLDGIDELVVEAGGRLYLAKDSRMRPEHLPRMYPRLDEWRAVRDELDPNRVFRSDQSRRLGL